MVASVARAIAAEIGRQDYGPFPLGDDLKLDWLDQGEVDFGLVAQAAIRAVHDALREHCGPGECGLATLDAALKEPVT